MSSFDDRRVLSSPSPPNVQLRNADGNSSFRVSGPVPAPSRNPRSTAKRWVFTVNNFSEDDLSLFEGLCLDGVAVYIIVGEEMSLTGTPHLQGYAEFRSQKRLSSLKKIHDRAHWEVARGNLEQNRTYCSKDGNFHEYGTLPEKRSGKRTDLDALKESIKGGMNSMRELREFHSVAVAKYPQFTQMYIQDQMRYDDVECHPLNRWQQRLNTQLRSPPHKRKIIFVVDHDGNKGKTWFARYYQSLHSGDTQIMHFGKLADMAFTLETHNRVLFLNCARHQLQFINYHFLENVKDGMVFNTKYESYMKRLKPCHVVVLMNADPDMNALSRDRYDIVNLQSEALQAAPQRLNVTQATTPEDQISGIPSSPVPLRRSLCLAPGPVRLSAFTSGFVVPETPPPEMEPMSSSADTERDAEIQDILSQMGDPNLTASIFSSPSPTTVNAASFNTGTNPSAEGR